MGRHRFTTPSLDGISLHTLQWGDPSRPPVVLLHGGGANAHWWDTVAPGLAAHCRVVALDFRGHGDSDFPDAVEPGAFGRDLGALLEHLGAPDAALVGHSMGAHVALAHASRDPRPRALVLAEPARGGAARERRRMRLALAARRTYRTREEAIARFRLLPASGRVDESVRRRIAEHSVRREGERYGFKFDARWFLLPSAPRPDPAAVRARTLVVRGAESPLLSRQAAAELVATVRDARLCELADAGHNVHVEQPAAFLRAVLAFLAGG